MRACRRPASTLMLRMSGRLEVALDDAGTADRRRPSSVRSSREHAVRVLRQAASGGRAPGSERVASAWRRVRGSDARIGALGERSLEQRQRARASCAATGDVCHSRHALSAGSRGLTIATELGSWTSTSSSSAPSGSVPTARRAPSATARAARRRAAPVRLRRGHAAPAAALDVGLVELREVFLTHFHADHYLGLPGMLKTFALRGRELPLTVYGPPGLRELFGALRRIFGKLTYELELVELRAGRRARPRRLRARTFPVAHGVQSLGYALVEHERPGRFDVETADARSACPRARARRAPGAAKR